MAEPLIIIGAGGFVTGNPVHGTLPHEEVFG